MLKNTSIVLVVFCFSLFAFAESETSADSADSRAYWDFGIGFGGVRFEHYPASDQSRMYALPFPTFQYRGRILRADDRDGAHLYLYKGSRFTLEVSGHGTPALMSSDNNARQGMEDLPWMAAMGPKLVTRLSENLQLSFNAYQAIATDFVMTRTMGGIFEGRMVYSRTTPLRAWGPFLESGSSDSKWTLSVRGGSRDYLALYFEVLEKDATPERPKYEAREGLLNHSLSYFQSFKSGRLSIYVGGGVHSYEISANRHSPLHKSPHNWTALLGFNYTLGESARPAIPEEETSSILETLRRNRQLRDEI